jgi:hypothetical protein
MGHPHMDPHTGGSMWARHRALAAYTGQLCKLCCINLCVLSRILTLHSAQQSVTSTTDVVTTVVTLLSWATYSACDTLA